MPTEIKPILQLRPPANYRGDLTLRLIEISNGRKEYRVELFEGEWKQHTGSLVAYVFDCSEAVYWNLMNAASCLETNELSLGELADYLFK